MNGFLERHRWALPSAGLLALALTVVVLVAPPGWSRSAAPVWTEQPVSVSALTIPAPNWVEIAKAVKPAVVNVSARRDGGRGTGSGFIINPDGYVVTNNHVVEDAGTIRLKLSDGREFDATIVGRDPKTDLALLKVDARGLPVIPLGDSAALQVGEPVMAIGNPFGLEQTVTTGIVSATGRVIGAGPYDDFVQTDAPINPGNSGGPLVNARGQVVGINSVIFSRTGGSVGIGFSIPVNLAKSVFTQLAANGRVERGWLGVTIQELTPALVKSLGLADGHGALVAQVTEDSPAAVAGVKQGDVIVSVAGRPVARSADLPPLVANLEPGRPVALSVIRDGKPVTLNVTVARLDDGETRGSARASAESQGRLGLVVGPLTPDLAEELSLPRNLRGVVVREVRDGSPAAEAGLRPADVILQANRRAVTSVEELRQAVEKTQKGNPILLLIRRDKAERYVTLTA
ncbi:MAG TPA: DegQ family serine endoprotease [Methylomirabilota bacterium]|nr:DegQ family serine endoprotease [Methylomirabilota bacterium]